MATTTNRAPYNLPRDTAETTRLNLQHSIYVASTGYLLHPSILARLPLNDIAIAEIGTGSGIWLRDLAAQNASNNSTWTYTGFDISSAQFPPPTEQGLCSCRVLDILSPIPEQYLGKFDVVHLRLLICGLTGPDWRTTAANVYALLKPGGSIQWHESDFRSAIVPCSYGGTAAACTRLVRLFVAAQQRDGKLLDDVERLPQTLLAVGFEDIVPEVISSNRVQRMRASVNEVTIGAVTALTGYAVKTYPDLGVTKGKLEVLLDRARKELRGEQAYFMWDMYVVTGRKSV